VSPRSHTHSHLLLRVDGLGVTYPSGHRALDRVGFDVAAGEVVAVVGPNGAGKSTLFRSIVGLLPHEGSVELGGVHCHHERDRLGAAYIPQRNAIDLDFPITVHQVVLGGRRRFLRFGQRPGPAHRRAALAALEVVGLVDLAARPLTTLSGGQVQRTLVARAIAQEAQMLLLDEALSGVDRPSAEELLDLFGRLSSLGHSVLVATHDLDLVRRRFARCLAVNGRLVADGGPATVLDAAGVAATFGAGATR
jgi:ABC-type Mn2+/Zn2+ transport system ATPase subunit